MRRIAALAVAAFCVIGSLALSSVPANAAGPTILGAGSTWSQIAIDQWRTDVVSQGLSINYQGVGSTQGRAFFIGNSVDFAVSEIPFQSDELPTLNRKFKYLPIVAGGTSMMYNVKDAAGNQIRNLKLSPSTIAGIFLGHITSWSDRAVTKDYGKQLPNTPIKVIVRSDGSGTSAQFSAYLNAMQHSAWAAFARHCKQPGAPYTQFWPYGPQCYPNNNAIGQRGSDGVANYIANPGLGVGAIGYVEAGYAIERNFPVVAVQNRSGAFVYPTAHNVATALSHARIHADSTQDLSQVYTAPEKTAYPISSYSYMIVPTDNSITPDKGAVLGKFIIYFACTGQQAAERLGYSPMPKALVGFAFAAEKQIPGAPAPPPLTGSACPNPTLTGEFWNDGQTTTTVGGSGPVDETDTGGPTASVAPSVAASVDPRADKSERRSSGGETITQTASPEVLSPESLAALKKIADARILGLQPGSPLSLVVIAGLVLILVFGPLLLRMRHREG